MIVSRAVDRLVTAMSTQDSGSKAIDNAATPAFVMDGDGMIVEWSAQAAQRFVTPPFEALRGLRTPLDDHPVAIHHESGSCGVVNGFGAGILSAHRCNQSINRPGDYHPKGRRPQSLRSGRDFGLGRRACARASKRRACLWKASESPVQAALRCCLPVISEPTFRYRIARRR